MNVLIALKRFFRIAVVAILALASGRSVFGQTQAETVQITLGTEEPRDYPMGPIGGKYRVTDGAAYVRVTSIDAGGPGATAGLLPGDCILGAFGKDFTPTSYTARLVRDGFHHGATQELGLGIERAEGGNGDLPLQILRPGTGRIAVTVKLPRSGEGANPMYLFNSAKFDATYEKAVAHVHAMTMAGNAGGYFAGWAGLTLLGHPDWDKTTGDRPYRNSINKLRDAVIAYINSSALIGVEAYRYDSQAWINANAFGIKENGATSNFDANSQNPVSGWYIGQYTMFLSEYLARTYNATATGAEATTQAAVMSALQRALAQSANTIQWWRQPPAPGVGAAHEGELAAGMVGHGGVGGDYAHLGYALGINACGTHTFAGFGFARMAGKLSGNSLDFGVRPRDGHYFGYSDADYDALRVPVSAGGTSNPLNTSYDSVNGAWTNVTNFKIVDPNAIFTNNPSDTGMYHPGSGAAPKIFTTAPLTAYTAANPAASEHFDPSIHEKFLIQWNWVTIAAVGGTSAPDEIHTGYIPWGCSAEEDVGKSSGSILGIETYRRAGGTLTADQELRLSYLKNFVARHYMWQQDSHAYCLGAQSQWAFATPFLSDRQLQFSYEGWSFFYALSRTFSDSWSYVTARYTNDNYLDYTFCAAIDFALPRGIARGQYAVVPGFNRNRIVARFDHPDIRWPTIEARYLESSSRTVPLPVTIYDGAGNVVSPSDYSVTWSQVSGVGAVTFGANNTLTFSSDGLYRVKAVITRISTGHAVEEPIDVVVRTLAAPAGYALGSANYQVYKNITGTTVAALTQNHVFPEYADISSTVTSAVGTYNGDNYGSRLSGLIIAPAAGNYTFYIASDDSSQLKLNFSSLIPAEGQVVAGVAGAVANQVFTTNSSQKSATYSLAEGQAVAFEAVQKEGTGGDHLSVAWSINGGPIQVIQGYHLARPVASNPAMKILTQPVSTQGVTGGEITLSFTTEGPTPAMYQWRRNGVQVGSMSTSANLTLANLSAGSEGNYDCTYTTIFGTLTTQTVHVSVTDVGLIKTGGLWREVYTGIGGSDVASLTSNAKYPYLPDASGAITSAMGPAAYGDNYGQRWTGWLTPPTTGSYYFYIASDDNSELWLSTDDKPANKVKIHGVTGYTGDRSWSAKGASAAVTLTAGQKYYLEVLHKEGGGGDHCAVAWRKPGDAAAPANGANEIPGTYLSYRQGGIYPDTVLTNVAPVFLQNAYTAPQAYATQAYAGYSLAGSAYDANSTDFAGLTFSKGSGPAWLSVAATGALAGTPTATDVGSNTFTVQVTDAGGLSGTATVTIMVRGQNHAPSFTGATVTAADAVAWVPYMGQTLATKVTDPDAWASLAFSKISGPAWLTVASNGALSGSPAYTDCGTNSFTVQVTDEAGLSGTATLTIVVRPLAVGLAINGVPASTANTLTGFIKGQTLALTPYVAKGWEVITKVDYTLDGTTLLGTSSTAPYGVSWTNLPPGTHTITLTFTTNVTSFASQTTTPVTIFVEYPPQVPAFNFVATSAMAVDKLIGQVTATAATAGATGPSAPARTIAANSWTLVSGDPNGIFALSSTGALTLKQPQLLPSRNIISLVVRVTDNTGITGDGVISIICNPAWGGKGVLEEQWNDGNQGSYPATTWTGTPTLSRIIPTFYSDTGASDCTRRFTGLLHPTVSGAYTFYLNSNDNGDLYLSTDERPENKVKIISNTNWWFEGSSAVINLVAGKLYYIEGNNWAIGSGNKFAVSWACPGMAKQQLPNAALFPSLAVAGYAWVGMNPPDNSGSLVAGVPITLKATTVDGTSAITAVEFYKDGVLLGTSATAPYGLVWSAPTAGSYTLKARAVTAAGPVDSDSIAITVGTNNDPLVDSDADGYFNGLETLLGFNPQSGASTPPTYYGGLVGWWNFDEAAGTIITDTSYRGKDGTMVGAPVRVNGHTAKALVLNGTSDGVVIGTKGSFTGTTDLTISAWVKTKSTADGEIVVQRDTTSYNGQFILRATAAGRVYWYLYGDSANQFEFTTTTGALVNDGAWHHIVAQREGLVGRVYVDGVLAGSATGAAVRNLSASIALAIGYDNRDKARYFNGLLDDVRLYSRALSLSELTSLYQEQMLAAHAPYFTSSPIAWSAYSTKPIAGSLASYAYDVNVGLGSDSLSYAKVSGPAWLSVAANGALSGTPAVADQGANAFVVRVIDSTGRSGEAALNVTVAPPPYWTNVAGGNWSDTANWSLGVIATGAGETADFSQLNLTAATTVTLDSARTLGALVFGDTTPSHDWTLNTANASGLALSNPYTTPSITVVNRSATIGTAISGTGGVVKEGPGTLTFSGSNNYTGGTIVNAGTLVVNTPRNGFNMSVLWGAVTVNAGATFQMDSNPTGYGGGTTAINLVGGSIAGTGGLGAVGIVYNLTGGTIGGSSRLDAGTYNSVSTAINSLASNVTSYVSTTGGIMIRNDLSLTNLTLTTATGTTPSGIDLQITSNIVQNSAACGITKAGAGTLALAGANTYAGATAVNAGTLLVNGSLGANTVTTVAAGATLGGTGTLNGSATINGTLAPGGLSNGIGTLTVKGTLTLAGNATFGAAKNGSSITSDQIAGATSIVAGGTLTVSATNQAFGEGDVITLFNVAPVGTFASVVLPPLESYLSWQTSDNYKTLTAVANVSGRAANTITAFTTIAAQTFVPGKTVAVTAPAASSGLPVTLSVKSGPATISGPTLTLTGAGTVVVEATQVGSSAYVPATPVTTSFAVAKGSQTITFGALSAVAKGTTSVALTATASSGLAVSYVSSNSAVATVAGSTLTVVAAGQSTITAVQVGDANYNASTSVPQRLIVNGDTTLATADTASAFAGVPLLIDVLANDISATGSPTLQSVTTPAHGVAVIAGANIRYTATGSYTGTDTFSYTMQDSNGGTATATVTVTVYNQYASLAGWWRMNEGTGTTTADASANGRTATLNNAPTWTTGRFGSALTFNGTNMYLSIAGSAMPAEVTFGAWVKPNVLSGVRTIFGQNSAVSLRVSGSNLLFTTLGVADYSTSVAVSTAGWQHVVATFKANTTGGLKLYVDGVLKQTLNTTGVNANSNSWFIGMVNSSEYFSGDLDDARIFSRLLPVDEILALATAPSSIDAAPVVPNVLPSGGYATFTVYGAANQPLVLAMVDDTSVAQAISTSPDGTTWTAYAAGSRFTLPAAGQVQVRTAAVAGKVYTLTATAVDGTAASGNSGGSNQPPTITSNGGGATASVSVAENTTAVTTVVATDPESAAITYSITGGADAAKFALNASTGALTFVTAPNHEAPASAATSNAYTVVVTATDPANASVTQTLTVTVTNVNEAPVLAAVSDATLRVGNAMTAITLVGVDPDAGDPLTYSATGLPAGVSLTGATVSGTPTTAGVYAVTATVKDAGNLTAARTFTLTVEDKIAPTLSWPTPSSIPYGTALSVAQLNATTSVAGTFTYSPALGTVLAAGTPTLTATFTPTDTATYATATKSVTLAVAKAALTATADNKSMTAGGLVPALTIGYSGWQNGDTMAAITAPTIATTATSASGAGTYPITLTGGSAANYAFNLFNGTLTVNAVVNAAPVITVQPQSQSASAPGGVVTFSVTATGTPPLSYQWYFNGTAVAGATGATLTLTNVQATAAGNYWVVVTNSQGSVKSDLVTFNLTQTGNTAGHAVTGAGYVAGQTVTVSNTLTYTGTATALSWSVLLPPGFSFASAAGSVGGTGPLAGDTQVLNWAWTSIPASPLTFTYRLNVDAAVTGPQELVALVGVRNGTNLQFLAQPDPLPLAAVVRHAADTDQDGKLSLLELTRVIELYNTRNGSIRTGCYGVAQTSTEDGYAAETGRSSTAVVTLGRYHTADSNHDGKLSLLELTRVIELFNFRSAGTRTGQYRSKTDSEDGFAPGP